MINWNTFFLKKKKKEKEIMEATPQMFKTV